MPLTRETAFVATAVAIAWLVGGVAAAAAAAAAHPTTATAGPAPTKCQPVLDAWCNNASIPEEASCIASIKKAGATLPLYARYDTNSDHEAPQWRCYSGSSLSPDKSKYSSGSAYCSRQEELSEILDGCMDNYMTVFPFNESGVHEYRIPLLLRTPPLSSSSVVRPSADAVPVLMAFAEARVYSGADSGPKHLAMRRSTDGGDSWTDIEFLVSDPMGNPSYDGLNLGAAVHDPMTNEVHVLYCVCAHKCPTAFHYVITSKDLGLTWSSPLNITKSILSAGLRLFAPGPGTGVALSTGRIVVAGWYDGTGGAQDTGSLAVYSDDHGASWKVGGKVPRTADYFPNESQLAKLDDDKLVIGMRNAQAHTTPCHCRLVSFSDDGGDTWAGTALAPDLVDPVCQGSTISELQLQAPGSVGATENSPPLLYVSNADNAGSRQNGTVHVSRDGGVTWALHAVVDPGSFDYSALALINSTALAVAWESSPPSGMTIRYAVIAAAQ